MSGIICCACSISAISVLSKIATNDELYCKGASEHIILDFRKPGEAMEIKIPGVRTLREDRPGQPVVGSDPKTASDYYHEQSIESSFSARYSKWDDNQAWSSQEWKTDTSMCDRSGQPVVTSWGKTRESQPSFFHEKTRHDGTAQSIVNVVIPRDRSGQPVVIPLRGATGQN